ncbi:MAG TPA: TolC family protein [Verrucomicrobiae bacterium]|nr:TolC family protein [Verrucomicrobiae bacterium]
MKTPLVLAGLVFATLLARASQPWTLERAIDYALVHNPDARIARQRIDAAQAGLEQADAAFWPQAHFQSSYTRTDNPMMVFGDILNQRAYNSSLNFNDVPNADNLNVEGMVTVPLYAGGKNAASHAAAKANAMAARQSNQAVRNELAFEVVCAFQTVLKTRAFIQATEAEVNASEHNLAVAQKRFQNGALIKSDVLDIEVQLSQAREDQIQAQNAETLAILTLKNLLGIEDNDFTVAETVPTAVTPVGDDFSNRPELMAAAEHAEAARETVRGAKSGYKPQVSAFGSLDHNYGWVTGGNGNSYSGGIMLQWDLWDGLLTRSKTHEAQANLDSSREDERKLRLAIAFEVQQARLDLDAANQRMLVTEKSVDQAEESERLTRARFEQGLAISTQLIDAETAVTTARVRRAQAESDQRIAVAMLRKALALPQMDAEAANK